MHTYPHKIENGKGEVLTIFGIQPGQVVRRRRCIRIGLERFLVVMNRLNRLPLRMQ